MQLFYEPSLTEDTKQFSFDKEESKHIHKVLRKKENDILHITNGRGWIFEAKIVIADQKNCVADIIKAREQPERNYYLHLAVAPTKMNDRYEWFLEKATEIGVHEITPIICEHSERKIIKTERFEKILQSAMKQSLQYHLPKLNPAISFKEFIKHKFKGQLFIAHCEDTYRYSIKRKVAADHKVTILIGPEGDFSVEEIELAKEAGFTPISLGSTRLRTETAAVVACQTVSLINE
ncbi:16S rRNA (uracil(1498)-N(3))-methyltransferase [Sungkyunkwania multivorans]|uniref:Ribosomal RNA small subunit methyltransferase E n=1 Tax=Sungkyunkwania multivorans TaxID=1173618 RepID=A0ABW3CYQ9_9FLAO